MADGITELAMMFKERDNKPPVSFVLGTVKCAEPPIIVPEGINFSLSAEDLIIPERLTKFDEEIKINDQVMTIHHEGMKLYDQVVLLPSVDGQKYFVMDRVVV